MSQTKAQLLDNIKDDVQLDARKSLRFSDTDSSHYVAFKAPATVSSNVTWTLPAADGSANYVLATDGSGTLSWIADPAGQWVTSGSNIYFTGGNVGIGDNSPSNPLSVTGASAFNGDVQFTGASYNVTWDKSDDSLEFADSAEARFGAGNDLRIYHNGSHSFIHQDGTGSCYILADTFRLNNEANSENIIAGNADGSVELYHNGNKKAETSSSGLTVTGNSTATSKFRGNDDVKISLGDGEDIELYHDGSHSYFKNKTGDIYFQTGSAGENAIEYNQDGAVKLYFNGLKKFETNSLGCGVTGNLTFADSAKAIFGAGDDLQIFHNGSASYIQDTGTGNLVLSASDGIIFQNGATTETLARFYENGACELFHNNDKKFETNSTGCKTWGSHIFTNGGTVTAGHLGFADDSKAKFGDGDDLQIYHDGTTNIITGTNNNLSIRPKTGENGLLVVPDGGVNLYHDDVKKFETYASGCKWVGQLMTDTVGGTLQFTGANSNAFLIGMTSGADSPTGSDDHLQFHHWNNSAWDKVFFVHRNYINIPDGKYIGFGASNDLTIEHDGNNSKITDGGTGSLALGSSQVLIESHDHGETLAKFIDDGACELYYNNYKAYTTNGGGGPSNGMLSTDAVLNLNTSQDGTGSDYFVRGSKNSTAVGAGNDVFWIYEDGDMYNVNGTFSQSSDSKLKENIADAPSQWADIKALKVRKFNFKESTGLSTHKQIGMVAQEVETTCPGLITERVDLKKTENSDGTWTETDIGETTKSIKLTVLYMKAVKALQEAMTRIETLETKVATLESA